MSEPVWELGRVCLRCTVLAAAPMLWEAQAGDAGAPAESDHGQLARSVLDAVAAGMQVALLLQLCR